ncbi:hypothetical protein EUX98_g6621 [Antrodiella citrinella]|uniref:Uncharacterized protein n=1 Tax=Antrodiella citrinella TaxID=2447956 RepID=A0A4S4MQC2_9APHY|nr:hypothetical protein EUX98_g6621 [Antrodiella citrinella]
MRFGCRFLTGGRVCDTHIYKYGAYPFDLIGPITVIWQSQSDKMHTPPGPSTRHRAKHQKKEQAAPIPETPKRMVWIRAHPSVFSEVYKALQTSTSYALEAAKKSNESAAEVDLVVEISDLRERLNIFEIMGPKSSQIIKGALKPTLQSRKEFTAFWQSLGNLQTTASLPRNMVIGFTVNDPRLTFPPKNAHVQTNLTSSPVAGIFPTSLLALSDIWAEEVRDKLQKPKFKKKDLDQRRSQSDNPGTSLQSTLHDDRIPVLLIQRSLESSPDGAPSGSSSQLDSPSLHGWTLVIPSGWSMPFFSSLIYTGTRVAGQRERQTQAFEAGKPYFPRDYPACKEYQQYSDDREEKESERWQKKPPAKRPNYQVLLTRSPWQPDWDVVLGLQPPPPMDLPAKTSADFVETQRHQAKDMKPWLLRGPNVGRILEAASTMFNHAAGLHEEINKLRTKRLLDPLPASVRADNLWKTALITVKLRMCGRGRPEDLAMIYIVDDEEHGQWTASFNKDAMLTDDQEDQLELANRQMHTDNIIGYVTTGNFSLSLGEAYAIGAVPLARLFELKEQATRMGKYPHLLVKVRDRGETVYRAAHLEVIEG